MAFCGIDVQASPSDPENFPFVVLGNKVDVDGGNSRVVSIFLFFMYISATMHYVFHSCRMKKLCFCCSSSRMYAHQLFSLVY